jgi:hypothetical protein
MRVTRSTLPSRYCLSVVCQIVHGCFGLN